MISQTSTKNLQKFMGIGNQGTLTVRIYTYTHSLSSCTYLIGDKWVKKASESYNLKVH